jgi:hypothetical protein
MKPGIFFFFIVLFSAAVISCSDNEGKGDADVGERVIHKSAFAAYSGGKGAFIFSGGN